MSAFDQLFDTILPRLIEANKFDSASCVLNKCLVCSTSQEERVNTQRKVAHVYWALGKTTDVVDILLNLIDDSNSVDLLTFYDISILNIVMMMHNTIENRNNLLKLIIKLRQFYFDRKVFNVEHINSLSYRYRCMKENAV